MSIRWQPGIIHDVDPDSQIDLSWNWVDCIPNESSISEFQFVVSAGVTLVGSTRNGAMITAWVSGVAEGALETITCRVTFDTSPIIREDRTIRLRGVHK